MGVDGGESAVSVHLVGGVWGIISPGLLAASPGYGKTFAGNYFDALVNAPLLLCVCMFDAQILHVIQSYFNSLTLPISLSVHIQYLSSYLPQIPTMSKTLDFDLITARACSTVREMRSGVVYCSQNSVVLYSVVH